MSTHNFAFPAENLSGLLPDGAVYVETDDGHTIECPDDLDADVAAVLIAATDSKPRLYAYAARRRWETEIGGAPWGAHVIATDRDSQAKLIAEMVAISAGLRVDPSVWKFQGGTFESLSNADMLNVIAAARTHVANAFATEALTAASIMAGTITTEAEIDAAFAA